MPTYLERPLFSWRLSRDRAMQTAFNYDARAQEIGFAGEGTDPLQSFLSRAVDVRTLIEGEAGLKAFEAFLDEIAGGQRGFWLGSDDPDLTITQRMSATVFRVVACGLADAVDEWAGKDLLFRGPDGTVQCGRIDGVELVGDEEEVTLEEALSTAISEDWQIEALRYVRLASAAEAAYLADHIAEVTLRVVEIPLEYAAPEDAEETAPAFLYELRTRVEFLSWVYRLTSYPENLAVAGKTYHAAPVTHGKLSTSTEGDQDNAELQMEAYAGNPFNSWLPRNIGPVIEVAIRRVKLDAEGVPTGDVTTIFCGAADIVWRTGNRLEIPLVSIFALGDWQLPNMIIGPRCNYAVFDPRTCRLSAGDYRMHGTIAALATDGSYADIESSDFTGKPNDWLLPDGRFETGARPLGEIRTVRDSQTLSGTRRRLWFNWPLSLAQVNDAASVLPGCDRGDHCGSRFNNLVNKGAHPFVPWPNPSIKGINVSAPNASKK